MSDRTRVYVTGLGAVSCLGSTAAEFWNALLKAENGLLRIERFDVEGSPYDTGGEVKGFEPLSYGEAGVSMGAQFACHAAEEALRDIPHRMRDGLAVVLSTNFGPSETIETLLDGQFVAPHTKNGPIGLSNGPFAWDVEQVARAVGAGGERVSVSLSCSSGNAAIAYALDLLRSGAAGVALAGGYDSMQKITWAGLASLRVMAMGADGVAARVRPFDRNRSGTIFSEGAGVLVVETAEHALKRGAQPLAEVAGAGLNNNALHMTHADSEGEATADCVLMALADAKMNADDISHVNAHGTGTKLNDAIETRALTRVFGSRTRRIPVTSLKGGLGHAMGAASALEAVACVLTLKEGLIPPTANFETPDPECDLDVVAGSARQVRVDSVLNSSAGIGGNNAAIILKKV